MINSPDGRITEASRALYEVACHIVKQLPEELSEEIALMGSAGWGHADESSDVDLAIWVERLPPLVAITGWLEQIGATHIRRDDEDTTENQLRVICQITHVWVELDFHTRLEYEKTLSQVVTGTTIARGQVIHGWNVVWATPLRTQGLLAKWQQQLSEYPDGMRDRLIAASSSFWRYPHRVEMLWTLAHRQALLGLDEWLSADLQDALRILFAINRQWEPDWKNLGAACHLLTRTPDRLVERVNDILLATHAKMRVALAQRLILDILELVPGQYDVSEAVANIRASLQKHAALSG
jgi:hypothetical protein